MARNRAGGKCQGSGTEVGTGCWGRTADPTPAFEVRSPKPEVAGDWALGAGDSRLDSSGLVTGGSEENYEFGLPSPCLVSRVASRRAGLARHAGSVLRNAAASHYVYEKNELSVFEGNALIAYLLENKPDNSRLACGSQKTPGGKNEGFSHYVVENK
jgi:hypothetical protein